MKQFCIDVVKFLESEYNDSYRFEVKHWVGLSGKLTSDNNEKAELIIKISPHYQAIIVNENMQYLFGLYLIGVKERGQYRWQKELIDMIEGS